MHHLSIASLGLFTIGCVGIIQSNRRSILHMWLCIEMILLAAILNFVSSSAQLNDLHGQITALFVLTIAAAETVVALAILVIYYRQKHNIETQSLSDLREIKNG